MFESDLMRDLDALADEIDKTTEEQVDRRLRLYLRRRRIRFRVISAVAGATAAGFGVLALHAVGLVGSDAGTEQAAGGGASNGGLNPQSPGITLPVKSGEPCFEAVKYPVQEVARLAPTPIWMPNSEEASEKNLIGAWICAKAGPATLTFASHAEINFEPGWQGVDPEKKWSSFIDSWGTGQIQTISGIASLVDPPSEEAPRGEVAVISGDTLIRILGDGSLSADQLVDIARSIDLQDPVDPK